MIRTILLWALVLALGAFALQWLEYRFFIRAFSWQVYVGLIGAVFAAGGVWVGFRLAARARPGTFQRNDTARVRHGVTQRFDHLDGNSTTARTTHAKSRRSVAASDAGPPSQQLQRHDDDHHHRTVAVAKDYSLSRAISASLMSSLE